jgi:hypothetical protein
LYNKEISQTISHDLDINIPSELSDEEMIDIISVRVEQLLKADPDLLMSYMYRLDVLEKKIKAALQVSLEPVHLTFARLIWERQKERMQTKKKYKQDPIEGWDF